MAKQCINCKKELATNAIFCTECGTRVDRDTVAVNNAPEEKTVVVPAEKKESIPAKKPDEQPAKAPVQNQKQDVVPDASTIEESVALIGKYAPTSVMAYFGMILLFSIPVAGWIACFVMCFAAKKQSTKNFARAVSILLLVAIMTISTSSLVLALAMPKIIDVVENNASDWVVGIVSDVIEDYTDGQFTADDLLELLEDAKEDIDKYQDSK